MFTSLSNDYHVVEARACEERSARRCHRQHCRWQQYHWPKDTIHYVNQSIATLQHCYRSSTLTLVSNRSIGEKDDPSLAVNLILTIVLFEPLREHRSGNNFPARMKVLTSHFIDVRTMSLAAAATSLVDDQNLICRQYPYWQLYQCIRSNSVKRLAPIAVDGKVQDAHVW